MQYTLIFVGVTWEYLRIEFGLQLLILEYLEGYCVYIFKVNYIYQHSDLIILNSCISLKINIQQQY